MGQGSWSAPNDRLAAVMREADLSRKALARLVRAIAAEHSDEITCSHTTVGRWLDGSRPRVSTARYITEALSRRLGRRVTLADLGLASAAPLEPDLGLSYQSEPSEGVEVMSRLWQADLDQASTVTAGSVSAGAWNEASLAWLLNKERTAHLSRDTTALLRVGTSDALRLKSTTAMFASLDDRFGGGHARRALIEYLRLEVRPLLEGRYTEGVGRFLFSAAAEATLLAAWMSYDAGSHRIAQRYFIQALGMAEAGRDRQLAASILGAMSHQATFLGRLPEAANLAGSARLGVQREATATLRAHFYAMEARALARLGDNRGCDHALTNAVAEFERRSPQDDPAWISYFDEAELAAEIGHCFQNLGRAREATTYASQSLVPQVGSSPRSSFLVGLVLANAHLDAGNLDAACEVARGAVVAGETIKSARCVAYLSDFRSRIQTTADAPLVRDFTEAVADSPLWLQAAA